MLFSAIASANTTDAGKIVLGGGFRRAVSG